MRIWILLLAALALPALLAGQAWAQGPCELARGHAHGCLWTSIKGPGSPGPHAPEYDEYARTGASPKVGKACGWNLLHLVAVGDVRIATAMRDGGITKISSVDYQTNELLTGLSAVLQPLFARYCTVVTGE
jgi:hypothetical protein